MPQLGLKTTIAASVSRYSGYCCLYLAASYRLAALGLPRSNKPAFQSTLMECALEGPACAGRVSSSASLDFRLPQGIAQHFPRFGRGAGGLEALMQVARFGERE